MRKGKRSRGLSWFVLLLCLCAAAGYALLEEESPQDEPEAAASWESSEANTDVRAAVDKAAAASHASVSARLAGNAGCESYEKEVEPGICSYIVDCRDAKTCGVWADRFIAELEEWYGSLTYSEEWEFDEEMLRKSKKDADVVASYPVLGNVIDIEPGDEDEEYYAWLWQRFAWIIPAKERTMISSFEVFEHVELMAYVIQNEEDYEKWTYAANLEQATYETERVLTDIHEFGHLLSLNATQIDPYKSEKSCKTYMWEEGCARNGSYMYAFYQQFWEDGDVEDEDHFVSEYAMNDEYEDFAESWSHFVVSPRPKGNSVVDQKLLFFHRYEELVMLRAMILGRMASWLERNVEYE